MSIEWADDRPLLRYTDIHLQNYAPDFHAVFIDVVHLRYLITTGLD